MCIFAVNSRRMLSKSCEYGIRATLYVASETRKKQRVSLRDIARKIKSPEAFTAKILQKLVKHNIVASVKGFGGGFEMATANLGTISMKDLVIAIDGDGLFTRCSLGLHECSETQPCPFHARYKPVKENLKTLFEQTSLEELMSGLDEGKTFLKL